MSSLVSQQSSAALYYAVLGKAASASTFDSAGQFLENGATSEQYAVQLLSSSAGQMLYNGKSTSDIVKAIYTNIYGSAPTAGVLSALLLDGKPAANIIGSLVDDLLHYSGFDSVTLTQQVSFENKIDTVFSRRLTLQPVQVVVPLTLWPFITLLVLCKRRLELTTGVHFSMRARKLWRRLHRVSLMKEAMLTL